MNVNSLKENIISKLASHLGKTIEEADAQDIYTSLALVLRDSYAGNTISARRRCSENSVKQAYYLSMEFLPGRLLPAVLDALSLREAAASALSEIGFSLEEIESRETDPGLGNGGLGRLAACFLESFSSLGYPVNGNGIRYTHGLFRQEIVDGYQREAPDEWLRFGNPWEIRRDSDSVIVSFGGTVKQEYSDGRSVYRIVGSERILAIPFDTSIIAKDGNVCNLRLWSAEIPESGFDFGIFSRGDHPDAVAARQRARAVSDILYPDDSNEANRVLRLKQQYFFVSAGLTSILAYHTKNNRDIRRLADFVALHINDTHPALAVPELMRLLIDRYMLGWDEAWEITRQTITYTNHTIQPEALEKWDIGLYSSLLPRIRQITEEIDRRASLEFGEERRVIVDGKVVMANLCILGSRFVNGVSALHGKILAENVFPHFAERFPGRFGYITNGVNHRRWLIHANPALSDLLREGIGDGFYDDPSRLSRITSLGLDRETGFLSALEKIRRENKMRLINFLGGRCRKIDPDSIFDVQVKRFHAYKRQLLNALRIADLYLRIVDGCNPPCPVTFIFGGKAAPSYRYAKSVIKLINSLSEIISSSPFSDMLNVIFIENYDVSSAETIIPAADFSEQISAVGNEASGTGNMKFMFNGALTIGTPDGANIEIADALCGNDIYIFGGSTGSVHSKRFERAAGFIGSLDSSFPLLAENDSYGIADDFDAYLNASEKAFGGYSSDKAGYFSKSARNIAAAGIFSSDIAAGKYAALWGISNRSGTSAAPLY